MDVVLLTDDGDYGLRGVQSGTIIFQFLPEERGLALQILSGMHAATECVEARSKLEKLMAMLDPSFYRSHVSVAIN